MKKLLITIGLLTGFNTASAAVEYVKVCSLFGVGYYYEPGTDTCVNANTGITKTETDKGIVTGQTDLARRVKALESQFRILEDDYGIYVSE